jgi:hypothetical protein
MQKSWLVSSTNRRRERTSQCRRTRCDNRLKVSATKWFFTAADTDNFWGLWGLEQGIVVLNRTQQKQQQKEEEQRNQLKSLPANFVQQAIFDEQTKDDEDEYKYAVVENDENYSSDDDDDDELTEEQRLQLEAEEQAYIRNVVAESLKKKETKPKTKPATTVTNNNNNNPKSLTDEQWLDSQLPKSSTLVPTSNIAVNTSQKAKAVKNDTDEWLDSI